MKYHTIFSISYLLVPTVLAIVSKPIISRELIVQSRFLSFLWAFLETIWV